METLTPGLTCRSSTIRIATVLPIQFSDITDRLHGLAAEADVHTGVLNVQTLHTTTAVVVNEHEPLLLGDFAALLEAAASRHAAYRHDDASVRTVNLTPGERVNGHAHCQALLLAASVCLNVVDGRLRLGRWQRVFFVELDGPRDREASVVVFGEGRR